MPTVLLILGWRLFFFSNENNEPCHIHARKGDMECKYWLLPESFEIEEAFSHGIGPRDNREVRKIIFDHFDYIVAAWDRFKGRKS
jgi:hypothetical protein